MYDNNHYYLIFYCNFALNNFTNYNLLVSKNTKMLAHSSGIFLNPDFLLLRESNSFVISSHFSYNQISSEKHSKEVPSKLFIGTF